MMFTPGPIEATYTFRVLRTGAYFLMDDCPRYIPLVKLVPYTDRVLKNHGLSLRELHRRGGLSPDEIYAIVNDKPWDVMDPQQAVDFLRTLL